LATNRRCAPNAALVIGGLAGVYRAVRASQLAPTEALAGI
jgi:hypothetical protein